MTGAEVHDIPRARFDRNSARISEEGLRNVTPGSCGTSGSLYSLVEDGVALQTGSLQVTGGFLPLAPRKVEAVYLGGSPKWRERSNLEDGIGFITIAISSVVSRPHVPKSGTESGQCKRELSMGMK